MNHSESNYKLIQKFVSIFFNNEFYVDAIKNARNSIANHAKSQADWLKISSIIQNRQLEPGQPLNLVNNDANQVIDENSDEEAYVWLDKMVYNVERTDGKIEEY
ncbi:hypothetical protein HJG54_34220 [Leptolyngbya sp. NK1-12]|uniref:Uncharacterized protein n=1 Tax=Leptolyngbya sp. NK1-12 TaxID=2547451 RepID=A0AA96WZH7_9CYAN|nr:hypothetical protein [Leptolyngbya sp. NK1-12]WNZ26905.1 hypothetical protein HJG54_28680 [Leptolyngbya sp. NK1-12]WNZ27882.1 hypothetical protein HJG54_34220 [Leptolyngbya sp. NK1-12]